MHRNFRLALAGTVTLLGLGLAGCTDPTVGPASTVAETTVFNSPSSYRAFLAKIYAGLTTTGQRGPDGDRDIQSIPDEGFSQYMRLYWEHQEMPTDEAVLAWNDGPVQEFNGQVWSTTNSFLSAMFARVYFQIGLANEFLRQTTDAKLSERGVGSALRADIQVFRAEARFLRALSYWHGVDLFGPIPLVTSPSPTPPAQATRQQVFDFIVAELNEIQTDLPAAAGSATYGRATKEAAQMLLAHVYLNGEVYTGTPYYAEALAAAEAVINSGKYSLNPVYLNNFKADNHTSPEIIFPIVSDGQNVRSWGGTTFLVHAMCGGSSSDTWYQDPALYGIDGCWWGLRLKPEAYARSAGDPRGAHFFTTGRSPTIASLTDFSQGITNPKFTNVTSTGANGSHPTFPDTDFPMFRLADAYLIYAEANLRGGGGSAGQALTYVNALRQRAYGDNSGDITAGELDLPFILDERGKELLWEAHRRTDLIRFGLFTGGAYVWSWKGNVQAGAATDPTRDLYPIPASQLSANPNLQQNPGY